MKKMTNLIAYYNRPKNPTSPSASPQTPAAQVSEPAETNSDYQAGFQIRNNQPYRKLAIGLGTAAILAVLATPAGQRAASNVLHETRETINNIPISVRYGDAGIFTYTAIPVKLSYETTPRAIAENIAGDGNIAREIGLADLLARYITRANGLPNENAAIKAGQNIRTLVYDNANGRSLGSLVDAVEKAK